MPSIEHIKLSRRAIAWLTGRMTLSGMRWGREIKICDGFVADAFAIGSLQWRYAEEFKMPALSYPELTMVFESKVSRSDFISGFKAGRSGDRNVARVNLSYCVCPKGLIKPDELPTFWGLLEKSGAGLRLVKQPTYQPHPELVLFQLAHTLLWNAYNRRSLREECEWLSELDHTEKLNKQLGL